MSGLGLGQNQGSTNLGADLVANSNLLMSTRMSSRQSQLKQEVFKVDIKGMLFYPHPPRHLPVPTIKTVKQENRLQREIVKYILRGFQEKKKKQQNPEQPGDITNPALRDLLKSLPV